MTTASYFPRLIKPLGVREISGWRFKRYQIRHLARQPNETTDESALEVLKARLDSSSDTFPHYNLGIHIVHYAKRGTFCLCAWWIDENVLRSWSYYAEDNMHFTNLADTGIMACVWELEVFEFERQAWLDSVLRTQKPDANNYLTDFLEEQQV